MNLPSYHSINKVIARTQPVMINHVHKYSDGESY